MVASSLGNRALLIRFNICFGYPQHMFLLRNKKINFLVHTLIWAPTRENLSLGFAQKTQNSLNRELIENRNYKCMKQV